MDLERTLASPKHIEIATNNHNHPGKNSKLLEEEENGA